VAAESIFGGEIRLRLELQAYHIAARLVGVVFRRFMKTYRNPTVELCRDGCFSKQNYRRLGKPFLATNFFALWSLFTGVSGQAQSLATMTIQAGQPGASVSSNLFGIFFEEINYAGDGGLYGEMVRNRSFAESTSPNFWTLAASATAVGTISVDTSLPLSANNLAALNLTMSSGTGSVGAVNAGYWGMSLQSGATYDLNFFARGAASFSGPVQVRLQNSSGSTIYAQTSISGLTTNWQRFSAALVSSDTDTNAQLALSISNASTVWLDEVSLFPRATFNNRTNGLRLDLANMLAAMKPSFLRYPGGNFIESWNVTNAVRWKKTIGDLAQRPGHNNDSWGYWSTDGYGLDEAFRQCEDMGMEMLYGINAGLMLGYDGSANNTVPLDQMGPWVQDAVDLISYANDATNTFWGAQRAVNGHSAPYNLKYLEIGNENGGSYLNDRYTLFYDAIKAQYPDVHLLTPGNWGGGMPWSRPVEIADEHYYSDPATFISYATKYDSYSRSGPKIFVGEYAVTSGFGTYGNLAAALGEAAFMTGMERNSDIVQLASYAPLFANVNGIQWHPDLIYYDNSRSFGTPSYYVQKMFSLNRGDVVLPVAVVASSVLTNPPPQGAVGVGSWSTAVQYTNLVVTSNGVTLYQSDFVNQGTNGWRVYNGTWGVSSGRYQQTSTSTIDCRSTTGSTNWANYTISMRARKTGGSEGFLILFNWLDDNNWTWLNLGGWGNTLHGIEQDVNGSKAILGTRASGSIQNNQWYDISIVLTGTRIQCYLNGTLIQDVTYPATSPGGLYASSTYNQRDKQIIVKAVNPYGQALTTTLNLAGVASVSNNATMIQLTSGSPSDENSFSAPTYVSPITNLISNAGTNFTVMLPANSLSILRLQLPSPLPPNGLKAVVSGWQVALSWSAYNTATNYVIKRATAVGGPYSVIAVTNGTSYVDSGAAVGGTYYYTLSALLPAGPTPDTTPVSAVVGVSLQAYLPFDDASGTVATDVTGNGWSGALMNSPSWVGGYSTGAVNLSGSSQYVSLPTGVVSNLNSFSITAWVNLGSLSSWSRIFDFGTGTSAYMFMTPQSGAGTFRFAITTNGYGAEQQISSPSALPTGGWHHVAVTLSGGVGILYLDGVAVGTNSAMTLSPSILGSTTQNWIGRSQFSGDAYLAGAVDDLRIYSGALGAGELATFLTPLATPTGLSATPGDARATLTWSASANANGYSIAVSTNSGGPYVVKLVKTGLTFTDTNVLNGVLYYYVVSATNSIGGSAVSAPVSVRPVSTASPKLSLGHSGNQLQFIWPGTHTGWHLQAQTNSLGTNWSDVPGTDSVSQWTVVPSLAVGNVFYRLTYL
jgi:alpha-L-arabinofuranosidase